MLKIIRPHGPLSQNFVKSVVSIQRFQSFSYVSRRAYFNSRYSSSLTALSQWCNGDYDTSVATSNAFSEGPHNLPSTESTKPFYGHPLHGAFALDEKEEEQLTRNLMSKSKLVSRPRVGAVIAGVPDPVVVEGPAVRKRISAKAKKAAAAEAALFAAPEPVLPKKIPLEIGRMNLYEELKQWRARYGEEYQLRPHVVFPNKVLDSIVAALPETEDDLRGIKGCGDKTMNKISAKVLSLTRCVVDGVAFPSSDTAVGMQSDVQDVATYATGSTHDPKEIVKERRNASKVKIFANMESHVVLSQLNREQKKAATQVIEGGKSIFITGSAGTGKSHLLKYIVQELKDKFGESAVAVTASTGIAAVNLGVNLGGQTLHSFAGIGLSNGLGDPHKVVKKINSNSKVVERWHTAKVLVIDEISMIDRKVFELLDYVARKVRCNEEPFGGLQVVLVGDFLQLPPVPNRYNPTREFCFESPVWNSLGLGKASSEDGSFKNNKKNMIHLNRVMRQNDAEFVAILNDVRLGSVSEEQLKLLNSCMVKHKPRPKDGIIPTKLYSINKDVDKENMDRLMELPDKAVEVKASDIWSQSPSDGALGKRAIVETANRSIPATIQLKVGAQVMLMRNRVAEGRGSKTLVNGSRGVVTGFVESASVVGGLVPRVCFDNGQEVIVGPVEYITKSPSGDGQLVRMQVPLKLAWAITIHKSQGSTLTRAELMLSNTFDYGQAYVALSRVTSMDGLWLTKELAASSITANPLVLDYFKYTADDSK